MLLGIGNLLHKLLLQASEFKQLLHSGDYFPADHFLDLKSMLASVKVEGSYLQEDKFHQILLSLHTVFTCIDFFKIRADFMDRTIAQAKWRSDCAYTHHKLSHNVRVTPGATCMNTMRPNQNTNITPA